MVNEKESRTKPLKWEALSWLLRTVGRTSNGISLGFAELLESSLIRRSMEGAYCALVPGGRFIFTTQVNHPQLELIANTLVNRDGEP